MLTVDELKQVLHYDSETGVFLWVQNIKRVQIGDEAAERAAFLQIRKARKERNQ